MMTWNLLEGGAVSSSQGREAETRKLADSNYSLSVFVSLDLLYILPLFSFSNIIVRD